jgi:NarL family two-component system response regulator LiaR
MTDRTAVIIDRYPIWLDALESLLDRVGIEVVGQASSREDGIRLVEQHRPDVVVMELGGSEDDAGFALLRRARAAAADAKVIVVSDDAGFAAIETAFVEGASAYCKRSARPDDLAAAIRQSFEKSIYLPGVRSGAGADPVHRRQMGHEPAELTRRELEILRLVAEGHSNSALARMLWVTEQTVKFHLSNVYRKLEVANRTEAARWAQLHGLLSPSSDTAAA